MEYRRMKPCVPATKHVAKNAKKVVGAYVSDHFFVFWDLFWD
jgi:hypothetical protein